MSGFCMLTIYHVRPHKLQLNSILNLFLTVFTLQRSWEEFNTPGGYGGKEGGGREGPGGRAPAP